VPGCYSVVRIHGFRKRAVPQFPESTRRMISEEIVFHANALNLFQKPNKPSKKRVLRAEKGLFGGFDRVDEIHVYRLVPDIGSHVRIYIPIQGRREQIVGSGQIFTEVSRIEDFSGAKLPGAA